MVLSHFPQGESANHDGHLIQGDLTPPAQTELTQTRAWIEELSPGKVSLMPAGLEKQLTTQEMADLLEFLLQRK
jgi:hypothetical protein